MQKDKNKRIGRKCRLVETRFEQYNNQTRIMREIQFRRFFKLNIIQTINGRKTPIKFMKRA